MRPSPVFCISTQPQPIRFFPDRIGWQWAALAWMAVRLIALVCLGMLVELPSGVVRADHPQDAPSKAEMDNRTRMAIRLEEERQQEFKTTFSELETLVKAFVIRWESRASNPAFSEEDQKNLKIIEKLSKKIRSNQGGDDDDDDIIKHFPPTFAEQLKALSQTTNELKEQMEKSSRHVVSVGIITRAHRINLLVKHWLNPKR